MSSFSNRDKLLKMLLILVGILLVVSMLSSLHKKNSLTLGDNAGQPSVSEGQGAGSKIPDGNVSSENPETDSESDEKNMPDSEGDSESGDGNQTDKGNKPDTGEEFPGASFSLIGEVLNSGLWGGESMLDKRAVYAEGFYFEPLSDSLRRYITGISASEDTDFASLAYVHVLYSNMEGESTPGELICSEDAAKDLVEIFYELYRNDYRFTKIGLIEEYDGNITDAMAENLTFCLARPGVELGIETNDPPFSQGAPQDSQASVAGDPAVSRETQQEPLALLPGLSEGLCLVVNPLYNPLISYQTEGEILVTPKESQPYADRAPSFAYKIDGEDLCQKLFLQHGFTWGGNRNDGKAYCGFPLE